MRDENGFFTPKVLKYGNLERRRQNFMNRSILRILFHISSISFPFDKHICHSNATYNFHFSVLYSNGFQSITLCLLVPAFLSPILASQSILNTIPASLANLGINSDRLWIAFVWPSHVPAWLPAEISAGPIGPVFVYINNFFFFLSICLQPS